MLKKILTISALLCTACAYAGVEANQASQSQLDAIKGIGPALSQRIIAQRNKAAFVDWPDLIHRVHGVGNASAARFSDEGLTVNGKNFQGQSVPKGHSAPTPLPPQVKDRAQLSTPR